MIKNDNLVLNCFNSLKNYCSNSDNKKVTKILISNFDSVAASLAADRLKIKNSSELFLWHESVMRISKKIIKLPENPEAENIKTLWLEALKKMQGKEIRRHNLPPTSFDCTPAMQLVTSKQKPQLHVTE